MLRITALEHLQELDYARFEERIGSSVLSYKKSFALCMQALMSSASGISILLANPSQYDILGGTGSVNVQGENVQILDRISNEVIIKKLMDSKAVFALGSEEEEAFIFAPEEHDDASFVVFFDPLDGSSNIDVNVNVGTIFSIFYVNKEQKKEIGNNTKKAQEYLLQSGNKQVASGYFTYGAATMLVYTMGSGVHGYTLSHDKGASEQDFVLTHEDMHIPQEGAYYSANLGNYSKWNEGEQVAMSAFQDTHSLRYVGSLIADFHRTLLKGGLFAYPADASTGKGKLRLVYEVAPLALLMEEAGGKALGNKNERVTEKTPQALHERCAFVFGSPVDVDTYISFCQNT